MLARIHIFILIFACALPAMASAGGREDFSAIKRCVMNNNADSCHEVLTPGSLELFDRFYSYKLMPCLPTDFTYYREERTGKWIVVQATQPAGGNRMHLLRLAFAENKLDLPESLRIGLGEKWQEKLQMAEQLFLFIRANSGGNFRCDQLTTLVRK